MNLYTAASLAVLSLAVALCLLPPESAVACAPAPRHGEEVQIADESAIIIWDAKSKTQHFIRRATFTSQAKDFGFLVPTPTEPTLAEAGDEAFNTLAKLTEPRVVKQPKPSNNRGCGIGCGGAPKAESQVQVLGEQTVGDYKAAKLKADDADALGKWLSHHGYDFSPEIKEWVKPYIEKKWIISAFKIARQEPKPQPPAGNTAKTTAATSDRATVSSAPPTTPGALSATAVRMTFQTDQPYFPYREPPSSVPARPNAAPKRLLRVYFLSESRMASTLGNDANAKPWAVPQPWNKVDTRVVWANKIEEAQREKVLTELHLPKETPPDAWWLTEFEDRSSPRPGAVDVYFAPDKDQTPLERPPIVQYVLGNWSDGVMFYAAVLFVFLPSVARRCRRERGSATCR